MIYDPIKKENENRSCTIGNGNKSVRNDKSVTACILRPNRVFKEIKLDDLRISAIIDSGSNISLIRLDIFEKLQDVEIYIGRESIVTAIVGELVTLGHVDKIINIDNFDFKVRFYIAELFSYAAAIGIDILDQILTSNGATF